MQILLIEDDKDDQELFIQAIKKIDPEYNYRIAANGEEALNILDDATRAFDFIFCDLNMQMMNVYAFLKNARTKGLCKKVPVLLLTTSKNTIEAENCRRMDAKSVLMKRPIGADFLLKKKLQGNM